MAWLAGYTTVRDKGIHLLIHFQQKKKKKRGGKTRGCGGGDAGEKL